MFKLLQCFGAPFIVVHMGGSKETFFGSDRFELMASVIGELYSWNTGQGVTECFVHFLPQGKNGKDHSRMSKHNFKMTFFTFFGQNFLKVYQNNTPRSSYSISDFFYVLEKKISPRSREGISE